MRQMGGLRTKIPWTFWTMTIATFAIAGIPPFAGFFSKDEILWRAYQASWVYWFIGLFTAFLTAFYMFRLWFMTFFGEYRGTAEAHEEPVHDLHAVAAPTHGHGHGGIHESPRVMVVPLVVLAFLSLTGGWIGVPGSLGGSNRFEKFLGPVFRSTATAGAEGHGLAESPAKAAEGPEPQTGHATELIFTGISVLAGLLGFFLAYQLYYRNPQWPQQIAAGLGSLYNAVVHKYCIDELYATLFVKPLIAGSALILWHGIDQDVIDASVDNSAHGANEVSDSVRHMQSGNLRSYAGWVAAGAAAVIAYMVWMGTR
jgi:NADH-quinone oxidoreductase subunit L